MLKTHVSLAKRSHFPSSVALQVVLLARLAAFLMVPLIVAGCASSSKSLIASQPVLARNLVLMTDFGLADGAVSAMKGVARATAPEVLVSDLTHAIPPYNIWEAAYRLEQTYRYWPAGTVFVSVIDPGVGSERKSVAAKSKSGHIFVGPDNGLLTFLADRGEIETINLIDQDKQRLKGSEDSYTFHGRDLYVYVGARLAAGQTTLDRLGAKVEQVVQLAYQRPEISSSHKGVVVLGTIPVLDPNYGNVWTNIPKTLFTSAFKSASKGTSKIRVQIPKAKFDRVIPVVDTFAGVRQGESLAYFNSLMNLSLALNQGDFASKYKIGSGAQWSIRISLE